MDFHFSPVLNNMAISNPLQRCLNAGLFLFPVGVPAKTADRPPQSYDTADMKNMNNQLWYSLFIDGIFLHRETYSFPVMNSSAFADSNG